MKPDPKNRMGEEQANRIAYLLAGYLRQTLSDEEHDELDEWMTTSDENQQLFEELTDPATIQKGLAEMDTVNEAASLERIKSKIYFSNEKSIPRKRRWRQYNIAASIILLAGLLIFFQVMKRKTKDDKVIVETNKIQPGGNYATLTLGNGQTINLHEAKNGLIDSANGSEVLKTAEGQLSYESSSIANDAYHILTTPAGGQYSVLLPDGSRVWLNSSSSLKYPVAFTGKERVVELTGEGYFEVAPSTSPGLTATPSRGGYGEGGGKTPFIVKVGNMEVEVLGTHFNIMAYGDEPSIQTTLLEGRVALRPFDKLTAQGDNHATFELKPGEQGQMGNDRELKIMSGVDVEEVVAWKNGLFKFKDAPIEEIMRQVGRWYDAEVVYEGKVNYHFNATIYRKEPVNKLLGILEETERVHFRIEGKKIFVKP